MRKYSIQAIFICSAFLIILGNLPILSFAQQSDTLMLRTQELNLSQLDSMSRKSASPHALVYARATQLKDHPTAITALHYLLLEDPQNPFYQDSLANLYYRTGNFLACIKTGDEIIENRPANGFVHFLLASAHENLGELTLAVRHYEWLAEGTEQLYFWYQKAALEYQLDRQGECRLSLSKILDSPEDKTQFIRISVGNTFQDVLAKAAAYNLMGNLELKRGEKEKARHFFVEALAIEPEFSLAIGNLFALDPKPKGSGKKKKK